MNGWIGPIIRVAKTSKAENGTNQGRGTLTGYNVSTTSAEGAWLMKTELMPAMVKSFFRAGSIVAPSLVADLALRLFCTPFPAGGLSKQQRNMADRARLKLASSQQRRLHYSTGDIQTYEFSARPHSANNGTVLLVHGWTGDSRYMLAFVDPLVELGFDVICFDLPAHGRSSGRTTNLVECARALARVASHFDNIHAIVAHSFGGPVTAVALSRAFEDATDIDVRKIVLLASPNESADLVKNFGDSLGLNELAQMELEREFEIICGYRLADFTGSKFFGRLGHPLLVVHSEDDAEVSFQHGLAYRSLPNCKFVPLNGVGHRDILYSSKAIRSVARFLSQ